MNKKILQYFHPFYVDAKTCKTFTSVLLCSYYNLTQNRLSTFASVYVSLIRFTSILRLVKLFVS